MTKEQLEQGNKLKQKIDKVKKNISAINTQYGATLLAHDQKSLGVYEGYEIQVEGELKEMIQMLWEDELSKLERAFEEL